PQAPQPIQAQVELEIAGEKITLQQPAQYRYADKALGEIRREVKIAPAVSVTLNSNLLIVPIAKTTTERDVAVSLLNNAREGSRGTLMLEAPAGWTIKPTQIDFDIKRKGELANFIFKVIAPPTATESEQQITAVAKIAGSEYRQGYQVISYPHIEP